jgi:hypothetical protein
MVLTPASRINDKKSPPADPHRASAQEEPAYLRDDAGLACLTAQLGRINAQARYLEFFKKNVADAEEACKRDLAASLANSLVGLSVNKTGSSQSKSNSVDQPNQDSADNLNQWIKCWDAEVGAEYFYNNITGEASWFDPKYGMDRS